MRSRGFDAVINDSLIGGVLAFAQIIAGLVTGIAAALIAYYGFDTDWRAWAGAGFIIGVMLMVVVTEVVEAAVITLFIWSVRQREGEGRTAERRWPDLCGASIAAGLSPAPLVFVFSHPASPTIPACCSAPSPSPTAASWTRSTKIIPLADTRTSTADESEGLTPRVTICMRATAAALPHTTKDRHVWSCQRARHAPAGLCNYFSIVKQGRGAHPNSRNHSCFHVCNDFDTFSKRTYFDV